MKLSTHFSAEEFACHDGCGFGLEHGDVSEELLGVLERIRNHYNKPVEIISGCRCIKHNTHVGGAEASRHLLGQAADIRVQTIACSNVAKLLYKWYPQKYGIGRYQTWVHIDVRKYPARWGD